MEKELATCEVVFEYRALQELWPAGFTLEEAAEELENGANDSGFTLSDDPKEYILDRAESMVEHADGKEILTEDQLERLVFERPVVADYVEAGD